MRMNKKYGLTAENLLSSLPAVLRGDKNMFALAVATAKALSARAEEIDSLRIYSRIDELPEDLLDILAYDFKVDWWNGDYSLEEKRQVLKDSWRVHRMLGTKAAVETAISSIYPGTKVSEWFEYDGKPYRFRLHINLTKRAVIADQHSRVLELVAYYKNLRSHLDEIEYTTEAKEKAVVQMGGHVTSVITLAIPAIEEQYLFDCTVRAGGPVSAVATLPIPCSPDHLSFTSLIAAGGRLGSVASTPIPAVHGDIVFESSTRVGGKSAIISTTPLAEL